MSDEGPIHLSNGYKIPRAMSHTRIDKFLRCPLAYKFKYVDGKSELDSPPLRVGKAVHKCLEDYMDYIIEQDLPHDKEYMEELAYEINLPPEEWNEMFDIVTRYAENNVFDEDFDRPGIEERVALDSNLEQCNWYGDDVAFRSIVDFKEWADDETLIITDYKTNRRVPPQSSIQNNLQLEMYAWMASQCWPGANLIQVNMKYVRYNTRHSRTIHVPTEVPDIEEKLMGYCEQIAEAEEEEEFPANVSKECSWCAFAKICPEYKERREEINAHETRIENEDEAQDRAEDLKMINRIKNDIRDELKSYVDNHEKGVEISDQELNYHPSVSYKFHDKRALFDKLKELGVDEEEIWQVFSVTKRDLKSVLRDYGIYGKYEELQKELGTRNVSSRFSFQDLDD